MRKVTRKRFIAVICFIVAINLSLAPVAHASLALFNNSETQSAGVGHNHDQGASALKDGSTHQHMEHVNGGMKMDCENGATCKILCSVSISVLQHGNISTTGIDLSNRWFSIATPSLKSSICRCPGLSRTRSGLGCTTVPGQYTACLPSSRPIPKWCTILSLTVYRTGDGSCNPELDGTSRAIDNIHSVPGNCNIFINRINC